jgi:hypothetical protein
MVAQVRQHDAHGPLAAQLESADVHQPETGQFAALQPPA